MINMTTVWSVVEDSRRRRRRGGEGGSRDIYSYIGKVAVYSPRGWR